MKDGKFNGSYGEVAVSRCEREGDWRSIVRREVKVSVCATAGRA